MPTLKPNEFEIMKVLWEEGPLKPTEILERLPYAIKNSALRWQLVSLMERDFVKRRRVGKAYCYRAAARREEALKDLTRRMADVFCGGSVATLIALMIESQEDWSEEDIEALRHGAESKTDPVKPVEDWKSW